MDDKETLINKLQQENKKLKEKNAELDKNIAELNDKLIKNQKSRNTQKNHIHNS